MKKKSTILSCSVLSILLTILQLLGPTTSTSPNAYQSEQWDNVSTIVYEVTDENGDATTNISLEELNEIKDILTVRLYNLGYIESIVSVKDNSQIEVKIPNAKDVESISEILARTAHLTFEDTEGNVLMDGEMVKDAKDCFGPVDETGVNVSYVEIAFTKEGHDAFALATERIAMQPDGSNVMCICLDGEIYSAPRVMEKIDASFCIITGDFTPESAQELASVISSGKLPYRLTVVDTNISGE